MRKSILVLASVLTVWILSACNMPRNGPPVPTETFTPTPALFVETSTPTLEAQTLPTDTAAPTATPQDPLVKQAALCWQGPGQKYEVVSALKQNERVKLLGRGSISGWFVIENPIHHDPCWVSEGDLQIDAGTDLNSLRIINPPPTATPTKPPPTPTYTPVTP